MSMLRREARPLDWSKLEGPQREAVLRIVEMLSAAIDDLPGEKSEGSGGAGTLRLDDDRSSRIILLSGRRGTGKTTVLLSLKRLCEEPKGVPEEVVRGGLKGLSERAVWLEPIDMEPLAESTNLLAAVLARIDHAAKGPAAADAGRGPRGLLDPGRDYHDALLRLDQLSNDIALAWDGNLPGRAAHIDPDNYAVELMRAERARLDLNRRLREALDQVAKVFPDRGRRAGGPIFVLPVDDFDLNPPRCLDLLRLLRMISVPRLFTLVLGDVRIAEAIFNLKLSGDFGRLVAGSDRASLLSLDPADVRVMGWEVAANAVRKLLPPAQIVRLEYLAPHETLLFRPGGDGGMEPLHRLMWDCPLFKRRSKGEQYKERQEMESLRRFLLVRPFRMDKTAKPAPGAPVFKEPEGWDKLSEQKRREAMWGWRKGVAGGLAEGDGWPDEGAGGAGRGGPEGYGIAQEVKDSPYMAKELFHTSPRQAADLWQSLEPLAGPGRAILKRNEELGETWRVEKPEQAPVPETDPVVLAVVNVFCRHCQRAISEDRRLTPEGKRALLDGLTVVARHWKLDTGAFRAIPNDWPDFWFELRHVEIGDGPYTPVVYARRAKGWHVEALIEQGPGRRGTPPSGPGPRVRRGDPMEVTTRRDRWLRLRRGDPDLRGAPMEDSTAAAVMFVHDLIALVEAGRYGETLWEEMMERRERFGFWAITEWSDYGPNRLDVPWPTPHWTSFREYDVLLSLWKEAVDLVGRERLTAEQRLEYLVYAWIDVNYAIIEWADPIGFVKIEKAEGGQGEERVGRPGPDWDALIGRISDFFKATREQADRGEEHVTHYRPLDWYTELAVLLMPETIGADHAWVAARFDDTRLEPIFDHWLQHRDYIRGRRRRAYEEYAARRLEPLGRSLCTKLPTSPEGAGRSRWNEVLNQLVPNLPAEAPRPADPKPGPAPAPAGDPGGASP